MVDQRAVNGLFLPSPSAAVEPALEANAIRVFGLVGSTLARPRPMAREASVRFIVRVNGLSRHASRMTRRSFLRGLHREENTLQRQRLVQMSLSVSSEASTGTR